ncbi:type II secretion system F family protein [uncultured Pseudacidovorax sp.]|uniref:type II secretion system F family protein n=1 Tax=uncultured Pseudacidovorax sp. TaxID=679313 RepID=UPI0025ED7769|nr:type II secretion system F family protein [uncultured Pseudacidovorax sp.]
MAESPRIGLLLLAAVALMLAAAGLLLWQWAASRQGRAAAARHLGEQLAGLAENDAVPRARPAPLSTPASAQPLAAAPTDGTLVDPWAATTEAATAASTSGRGRLDELLPPWLQGAVSAPQLGLGALALGILVSLAGLLASAPGVVAALAVLLPLSAFFLWWRVQKFRRRLVRQLPGFIDAMVRLITVGNSTQAAFQLAIPSAREPLRAYLERTAGLVRAGVDLDRALAQTAESVRVQELHLMAAVLGLGVRYGGRADLLLERLAHFIRDREQADQELHALSAETRLSAWILGLLPLIVGGLIVTNNPDYFLRMWHDGTGRMMVFGGAGLQLLGAVLLYRVARL